MAQNETYFAFWSYTRFDDADDAVLTGLRERLERELRALSGQQLRIFQDQKDIMIGHDWNGKLDEGLKEAEFLIPIITPNFFASEACRAEVETFVQREQAAGTNDLILPVYWIAAEVLDDPAKRSTDRIAQIIKQHQWEDWQALRHARHDGDKTGEKITTLAKKLLERWKEHQERLLQCAPIKGRITWPSDQQHVARRATVSGEIDGLPSQAQLWTVVNTHGTLHPQRQLTPNSTGYWTGTAAIGGAKSDGQAYPIELAAVTDATGKAFARYLSDERHARCWLGVARQQGYRVIHTVTVVRDDAAQHKDLAGEYDEFSMPGRTKTGGTIAITPAGTPNRFVTVATNVKRVREWTGTLAVHDAAPDAGAGTYRYEGRYNEGQHEFQLDRAGGVILVTGRNTSHDAKTSFQTIWKKRT
jgi:hypothetical protein